MEQGGLQVPGNLGIGQTQERTIEQTWATFDAVECQLTRMGIPPMESPRCNIPKITADTLTNTPNDQFSRIFSEFSEWYGFVTNLYGRIQAKLLEVENEMSDVETHNRKHLLDTWREQGGAKKDKPTVQQMADFNALHHRYRDLKIQAQELEQQRLILQPRKEQLYRDWKTISRQVEIRGQELERTRIGGNMPARRPYTGTQ